MSRPKRPEPVRAVTRGMRLLEALTDRGTATLVELADAADLAPSTAHRLLATLTAEGYIGHTDNDQQYRLGYRVAALARGAAIQLQDIRDASGASLVRLRDTFGETANLVVLDGAAIVYVDQVESPRPVRMFSRIGNRIPAHASGGGKAMLAGLPSARREELLASSPLECLTPQTITSPDDLHAALAEVRDRGWAIDDREYDEDVLCVAAAITEPDNAPAAAITISGPVERMHAHDLSTLGKAVSAEARSIRHSFA